MENGRTMAAASHTIWLSSARSDGSTAPTSRDAARGHAGYATLPAPKAPENGYGCMIIIRHPFWMQSLREVLGFAVGWAAVVIGEQLKPESRIPNLGVRIRY